MPFLLVVMLAAGSFIVTQHAPPERAQVAQAVPAWPATKGFAAVTTTLAAPVLRLDRDIDGIAADVASTPTR